mgnify:FL=1
MSFYTGFGGFIADVAAAEGAGYQATRCDWCGNWDWKAPDHDRERFWCARRQCEAKEGEQQQRDAEDV